MYKVITTTLLVCSFCISFAQQYTFKAAAPTPRGAMACGVINTGSGEILSPQIFVCGGSVLGQSSSIVEAYDVVADTWSVKPSLLVPVLEAFGATVNNKLYIIGGYDNFGTATGAVQVYDPATNAWTLKSLMPTPRSQLSGAVINNKIYVVGGWPAEYNVLEIYDPATDTWTSGTNLTHGLIQNNGGAAFNNKLYIIGGKDYPWSSIFDSTHAYDPITNSWGVGASMPAARFAGAAVTYNSRIHFFGGATTGWTNNFNTHYIYNANTNTWATGLVMPVKRVAHVAAVANNKVYIIGGYDSLGAAVNTTIEYTEPLLNIASFEKEKESVVYANEGWLYLKGKTLVNKLMIYDLNGRIVASFQSPKEAIDLRHFPSGIYIVKIADGKSVHTEKIVL